MTIKRQFAGALALTFAATLGACNSSAAYNNASLYSVKQPVVAKTNYVLDVASGYDGIPVTEQQRIAAWFDATDLRYGDRVSIEDPVASGATRNIVASIAARHGILLSEGAPVIAGLVQPGTTRIVVTRTTASVPGCPDWSKKSDMNYANTTSPGYGCAVNGNLAAMVANPDDLISGQAGTGETVIMSSTKAIESYRKKAVTGEGALKSSGTSGGN